MDKVIDRFYTICSPDNLYWFHAGNDTFNVMDATWFDTASEAKDALADFDVEYRNWHVQEMLIVQPSLYEEAPRRDFRGSHDGGPYPLAHHYRPGE